MCFFSPKRITPPSSPPRRSFVSRSSRLDRGRTRSSTAIIICWSTARHTIPSRMKPWLYTEPSTLQLELPRPYRDYIAWLGQQGLSQAESFWRELLHGFDAPTVLSVDRSPGGLPSQDETTIYFRLPAEITDALRAQARKQGLTLN